MKALFILLCWQKSPFSLKYVWHLTLSMSVSCTWNSRISFHTYIIRKKKETLQKLLSSVWSMMFVWPLKALWNVCIINIWWTTSCLLSFRCCSWHGKTNESASSCLLLDTYMVSPLPALISLLNTIYFMKKSNSHYCHSNISSSDESHFHEKFNPTLWELANEQFSCWQSSPCDCNSKWLACFRK